MQTFLPYPDVHRSAACLDWRRQGKQRCEVVDILAALNGLQRGWLHHPAVRMWAGHERFLADYGVACCRAWMARGYRDTRLPIILELGSRGLTDAPPPWWGGPLHASHRAVLLAKAPEHYQQFGWDEDPAVQVRGSWPYAWPVEVAA